MGTVKTRYRVVVCLCGAVVYCLVVHILASFAREMWVQATLGPKIESEFGFTTGSPYMDDGSILGLERMSIESVSPGGVFANAGFVPGELVADDVSIGEFYQLLDRSRGKNVTVRLAPGGNGPPLKQRPTRAVTFKVPMH